MIKLWVIYNKDKEIIAWSTKKMSDDEVQIEITEKQYQDLISVEGE